MKAVFGALVALPLMTLSLQAQHDQHAPPDSAAADRHGCLMGDMHAGSMQGHGMMGSRDTTAMMMMGDSAMMSRMRFAPPFVLTNREPLTLTPSQVAEIESLMPSLPDSTTHEDHMTAMQRAAARVRDILTADQRAQVERLPAPCPMMKGSPTGGLEGHGHDAHRPGGHA